MRPQTTRILADESAREKTLLRLQVTTRSVLDAIACGAGYILVYAGRARLFGAGSERSLLTVNDAIGGLGDVAFVADDLLGGTPGPASMWNTRISLAGA